MGTWAYSDKRLADRPDGLSFRLCYGQCLFTGQPGFEKSVYCTIPDVYFIEDSHRIREPERNIFGSLILYRS